jgi:hypothetical protein
MGSIPILLEQIGTTTAVGAKRESETPDRARRASRKKAHLREMRGRWSSPVADLQASGLAH